MAVRIIQPLQDIHWLATENLKEKENQQLILSTVLRLVNWVSSQRSICVRELRLRLLEEYRQAVTRTRTETQFIQQMLSLRNRNFARASQVSSRRIMTDHNHHRIIRGWIFLME